MFIKDPRTNKDSVTLTAFIVGFAVCLLKLIVSGMTIHGMTFSPFSGVDFAAAVGSLGAIYGFRRMNDYKTDSTTSTSNSSTTTTVDTQNVTSDNRPPVEQASP